MASDHVGFVGSIPDLYDSCMAPTFIEPYARDLAARVHVPPGGSLLELACGTGRLTHHLAAALPNSTTIDATDLNDAMIEVARRRVPSPTVRWRVADVSALPFDRAVFDAVCCQFGVMFFPDRIAAAREVRRVLKPGGAYWLNTWGSLGDNPASRIANETAAGFFDGGLPPFFRVPFGYSDPAEIAADLQAGGFSSVEITSVDLEGVGASAVDVARGLVQGTPMANEIRKRSRAALDEVTAAVAEALARELGAAPMRSQMRALVIRAA
jgi:SAM-dependent methyltransferase